MHGTRAGYLAGCRNDDCKAAHAKYHLDRRYQEWDLDEVRHGERSTYVNYRCRCSDCKTANTDWMRAYRN